MTHGQLAIAAIGGARAENNPGFGPCKKRRRGKQFASWMVKFGVPKGLKSGTPSVPRAADQSPRSCPLCVLRLGGAGLLATEGCAVWHGNSLASKWDLRILKTSKRILAVSSAGLVCALVAAANSFKETRRKPLGNRLNLVGSLVCGEMDIISS